MQLGILEKIPIPLSPTGVVFMHRKVRNAVRQRSLYLHTISIPLTPFVVLFTHRSIRNVLDII